jgi:hypothetical protein
MTSYKVVGNCRFFLICLLAAGLSCGQDSAPIKTHHVVPRHAAMQPHRNDDGAGAIRGETSVAVKTQ